MERNLAYANMTATQANAVREPEVLAELTRLTNGCEALVKLTSELEERLKDILAIKPEMDSKNPLAPEPLRVPLAQAFHDRVVSLDNIAARLSSVINRLEI